MVLTIGEFPDPRAVRVIERLNTGLAMLVVHADSYHTIAAAGPDRGDGSAPATPAQGRGGAGRVREARGHRPS